MLGLSNEDVQAWAPVAAAVASSGAAVVALSALAVNVRGQNLQQQAHVTARFWTREGDKTLVYIHNAGPADAYDVAFCAAVGAEYVTGYTVPQWSGFIAAGTDTTIELGTSDPGRPREETELGVLATYLDGRGRRFVADSQGQKRFRPLRGRRAKGQQALERRLKRTRGIDTSKLRRVGAKSITPQLDHPAKVSDT